MAEMAWQSMGHASNIARQLRAVNRVAQPEIEGHRYTYTDFKELWLSDDGNHIVLTHQKDPVWQRWYNSAADGWRPVSVHHTREQAQQAAVGQVREEDPHHGPGTYVVARLDDKARTIRVRCRSEAGPEVIREIFSRLGYGVSIEKVSA